jgi:hypothetical protein
LPLVLRAAGWRSWNQFLCNADQAMMEGAFRGITDRSRKVNGTFMSLADLGYTDVGLDDCWQHMATGPDGALECGSHGPEGWTYHDESGRPLIDEAKFPDMKAMTALGHSLNLTVGWYEKPDLTSVDFSLQPSNVQSCCVGSADIHCNDAGVNRGLSLW